VTPPSVRFLGRRVYAAAVVMLACLAPSAAVPRRTLGRWLTWWRTVFANTAFWCTARARFAPPVDAAELPVSLLERFWRNGAPADAEQALLKALVFVSPITAQPSPSFSRDGP
jgi:hypothetical protein